ncbi:hypothetical protein D9Q98_004584 [Chlorella vulgaris]|uniref:Uncharacterized protein n=1 Tax=Chlorella vulgaris TaxID=3077 RepID=A0A9D4TQ70_CHLVU|nr:hypothetical protein D9Q98_004584 [Chlorella vulgaris]
MPPPTWKVNLSVGVIASGECSNAPSGAVSAAQAAVAVTAGEKGAAVAREAGWVAVGVEEEGWVAVGWVAVVDWAGAWVGAEAVWVGVRAEGMVEGCIPSLGRKPAVGKGGDLVAAEAGGEEGVGVVTAEVGGEEGVGVVTVEVGEEAGTEEGSAELGWVAETGSADAGCPAAQRGPEPTCPVRLRERNIVLTGWCMLSQQHCAKRAALTTVKLEPERSCAVSTSSASQK